MHSLIQKIQGHARYDTAARIDNIMVGLEVIEKRKPQNYPGSLECIDMIITKIPSAQLFIAVCIRLYSNVYSHSHPHPHSHSEAR